MNSFAGAIFIDDEGEPLFLDFFDVSFWRAFVFYPYRYLTTIDFYNLAAV